ncbi:hypothetical protein CH373_02285 [Leptospira perolatii]|uniref:SGNH hydrolase-type esterase domain-containing protein n=1 Tax=Leptospira perolatii TaxID=2023191 RepID=A0A2M9ZSI3_9LEPT|nr:SGNH/GDSL hydrolase family protein [Leptospira perolatii]PJZ71349.1 hypothetical protein CH360_02285 [Leptospira perolatii]PJZ74883.1 hypothetical protein CH373_02285 [Leptospira perolatii]
MRKRSFIPIWVLSVQLFSIFHCYSETDENTVSDILSLSHQIPVSIIGDSLCERSDAFNLKEGLGADFLVYNTCVSGRTVLDWIPDLQTALAPNPKLVIIELGTNDVSGYPTSEFPGNYQRLLSELKQRSNAIPLITILPPTSAGPGGYRTKILEINVFLKSLASIYITADMETAFLSAETQVPLYPSLDPIHPNQSGYLIMRNAYVSAISKLIGIYL